MATAVARAQQTQPAQTLEEVLIQGNLASLTPEQRVQYYNATCESMGLNPLTQPFAYLTLNGKLTLYAKRDATDQLRKLNAVSIELTERKIMNDLCIVQAKATDKAGRVDESTGAVSIKGLQGENLANAFLKAETKAKRRVTLSICGLGWLDESEVDSIPQAQRTAASTAPKRFNAIAPPAKKDGLEELLDTPAHDPETGEIAPSRAVDWAAIAAGILDNVQSCETADEARAAWEQSKQARVGMKEDSPDIFNDLYAKVQAHGQSLNGSAAA